MKPVQLGTQLMDKLLGISRVRQVLIVSPYLTLMRLAMQVPTLGLIGTSEQLLKLRNAGVFPLVLS